MTGYHPVRLPEEFSVGSTFGPGFDVRQIELQDSKAKFSRIVSPPAGLRRYDLKRGISGIEQLYELYNFFIARGGSANDFRLKDWLDYATTSIGNTLAGVSTGFLDEDLVYVTDTTYQMVKRYTSGAQTILRTILKPVDGTIRIGDGSSEVLSGFSINYETGLVTYSSAPSGTPTWGGEFDVVVGFTQETGRHLEVSIQALNVGALDSITCTESPNPTAIPQDRPPGGGFNHSDMGDADVTWSPLNGLCQTFSPSTPNLNIHLPNIAEMPLGGPHGIFINDGGETLTVKDAAAADVLSPFATNSSFQLWVILDASSQKTWTTI